MRRRRETARLSGCTKQRYRTQVQGSAGFSERKCGFHLNLRVEDGGQVLVKRNSVPPAVVKVKRWM